MNIQHMRLSQSARLANKSLISIVCLNQNSLQKRKKNIVTVLAKSRVQSSRKEEMHSAASYQ